MDMAATTASPLHDLTAFQRDILVVVERQAEPCGLDIKHALEAAWDSQEIHHGRLYPNLDDLVTKGLIKKGNKDRRTNQYSLSARGQRELESDRNWRSA
jgi:DNA-binding PadR family transcriptional regulator